ncbi:hypothetical protein PHJA_001148900 [Phtheirospermum japonicum]|uniref:Histone chaperone domain-containing protein n=1 Tax=Phtheirospermum japonicum TaxID=374723 RepID=A0A830C731_9LAMI|nr:hypothetical protein PHJA_001148900 [Phtheirospermum japonicum]
MGEEGEKQEIKQQLERAVCARFQHFKDQADSLTLESVRRLLEKDLGLKKFALDVHKRFIRDVMEKKMEADDNSKSEASTENVDEDVLASKEAEMLPEQNETKTDPKKTSTGDEEILEDSPIMGVLTPKSEVATQESSVSESTIKKAIWKRADHFQDNSENITLAGVRRLLEEDLGLEKNTLDAFKKFIRAKSVKDVKKKASDNVKAKKSKKASSEERSNSSHSESDEMEFQVKSRKEVASKRNIKKSVQPKKRKMSEESDSDISEKKQKKPAKRQKEEESDNDEDGSQSEDGVEKTAQRKEKPAAGYGKRVENLKTIIKACGMSVAPVIYKKAKQVPDEKREAFIVKELEDILSREGLSKNPSEKEIKDCKKRKDTARELEGIDMTNIISSSRRRSTFSFASPVTPVIRAKKDKVDAKDSKSKKNVKNHKDEDEDEEKKEKDNDEEEEEKKEKDDGEEEKKEKDDEEEVEEEVEDDEDEEEEEEEEEEESESDEFNEDDEESD